MAEDSPRLKKVRAVTYGIFIMLGAVLTQLMILYLCMLIYILLLVIHQGIDLTELGRNELLAYAGDFNDSFTMLISTIYAAVVACWCGMIYFKAPEKRNIKTHANALSSGMRIPALIALGFGSDIALSLVVSMFAQAFPAAFEKYNRLIESIQMDMDLWTILYVVILGPLAEELIFRGVILDKLGKAGPFWMANLLQAVFFGVYHMNVIQGIYAFCFGLILGMVVRATGTIFASIIVHTVFNGTSEVLELLSRHAGRSGSGVGVLFVVFAFFCFISGFRYFLSEDHQK